MNIFGIGRNYGEHIKELNNERANEPILFIKPTTALLIKNRPFYYPSFSKNIHFEVEILLKICKAGKNISQNFSADYYDQIGIGIDFTARDLQEKAKEKGHPWAIAKGFNNSAPISKFLEKENIDLSNLSFSLMQNGVVKQKGNTRLMLFNFDYIVSYISKFFTLKKGDIIFTGTPKGVGPIAIGDKLEAFIQDEKMLYVDIK